MGGALGLCAGEPPSGFLPTGEVGQGEQKAVGEGCCQLAEGIAVASQGAYAAGLDAVGSPGMLEHPCLHMCSVKHLVC